MADGLYVGMSAAAARAAQLDSVADNLANAETPGFRAARPAFQSFFPGGGSNDKVQAAAVATGIDLRPGMTVPTDNPLDVVADGDLYFGIETANGQAFTRNGQIQITPEGGLQVAGHPMLGRTGQPITIPIGTTPTITQTGDIMIDGELVDGIGLFRVEGPLNREGVAVLTPTGDTAFEATEGTLRVGELELGNAGALESTIAMINAQRHFETAMQAIQTYRRLDERAIEVGRVR